MQRAKLLFVVLLILLDQASKFLAIKFFPEIVVLNSKGVFGILPWWGFILGILGALGWMKMKGLSWGVALILAGGIGNIIDRVLWRGVVDFIKIWQLPIFNLADVFICLGVAEFLAVNWYKSE